MVSFKQWQQLCFVSNIKNTRNGPDRQAVESIHLSSCPELSSPQWFAWQGRTIWLIFTSVGFLYIPSFSRMNMGSASSIGSLVSLSMTIGLCWTEQYIYILRSIFGGNQNHRTSLPWSMSESSGNVALRSSSYIKFSCINICLNIRTGNCSFSQDSWWDQGTLSHHTSSCFF